jgi:hypothetical protein
MKFAKLAEAELRTIPGTTEIKLTVEDGIQKSTFKWTDKMSALGLTLQTVGANANSVGTLTENLELVNMNAMHINITMFLISHRLGNLIS